MMSDGRRPDLGQLLEPDSRGYDEARQLWNVAIDLKPAFIALPRTAQQVAAAIRFARERGLPLAVRGGGHSVAGYSAVDGGMMINLSRIKQVDVDTSDWTARCGGGALLDDLDSATWAHRRAVPSGHVSHTGVGGLTVGGGIGWLMRRFGLTIDHLIECQVVTADAEVRTVNAEMEPDLFWAIRGAGANFGIVTSFRFRTVDLSRGLLAGSLIFPWSNAREALRLSRDIMEEAPDELTINEALFNGPRRDPLPTEFWGKPMLAIGLAYAGATDAGARVIEPLRKLRPLLDLVQPSAYPTLQSMNDLAAPWGLRQYSRAHWQGGMPDDAIEALLSCWEKVPAHMARIVLARMGGAIARVADDETAFSSRAANRLIWLSNMWSDPSEDVLQRQWLVDTYDVMEQWSVGGGYVNVASDEPLSRIRATYGDNWDRLVALKDRYDPENVFCRNQNIPPSAVQEALVR
jgi:FAD/FMN-containing dehydrogenase